MNDRDGECMADEFSRVGKKCLSFQKSVSDASQNNDEVTDETVNKSGFGGQV